MVELNTDIPLNSKQTNANIKFHILDDAIMKKEGFSKVGDTQYYCSIPIWSDLELNIDYDTTENLLSILVLDWNWGQPFDYQYLIGISLEKNKEPKEEWVKIKEFVESKILHLQDVGILSGYNKNDII